MATLEGECNGMEWTGWYTIAVLVLGLGVMAKDIMGPDFAMMGMLTLLMIPGSQVVSVADALEGFSNEGLLTVAILFVLAAGISETGALDYFFTQLLGRPATTEGALVRLVLPVVAISAFLNNTPVVAIMIPIVMSWCRKAGLAPGHLFIPLSYASIIGGTITLIGTSTNLVVSGKQRERFPDDPPIGMFDITPYGLPVALAGAIYIVLFAPRLLPGHAKRRASKDDPDDAFLVGLRVLPSSPVIGKTLAAAGMRGLPGVYLASVQRGETTVHAVSPDFILLNGDVLVFAGELAEIAELAARFSLRIVGDAYEDDIPALLGSPRTVATGAPDDKGSDQEGGQSEQLSALLDGGPTSSSATRGPLTPATPTAAQQFGPARLYRARVRTDAPDLLGSTVRDARFRTQFGAAIVSIVRDGTALRGRLGDAVLCAGDELLLDTGPAFSDGGAVVAANLDNVERVSTAAAGLPEGEREFMFAFRVEGRDARATPDAAPAAAAPGGAIQAAPLVRSPSLQSLTKGFRGGTALAGKTIEAAGLRGLPDVFLVAIERGQETLHAVGPRETLRVGDILWFAGNPDGVISLRKIPGLNEVDDQVDKLRAGVLDRRLVQVVLARSAPVAGKTVREARFRSEFDAAIIALHRAGHRVRQRIGDIELAAGDVLLLDTGTHFLTNHRGDSNFALVAEVANSRPPRFNRLAIALVLAVAAIGVYVAEVASLVTTALVASGAMLLTGCLSGQAARESIKWDVIVTVAAAFGISNALENTCAADAIAELVVSAGKALGGEAAILIAIYLATVLLSNVIANNAAAALMYPISATVAAQQGISQDLMAFNLMLAASAAYAVPFGYQTNLMVYGAGGYQFKDFVRFGAPMQVWQGVISCIVIIYADYWVVILLVIGAIAAAVFAGPTAMELLQRRRRQRGAGSRGGRDEAAVAGSSARYRAEEARSRIKETAAVGLTATSRRAGDASASNDNV